MKSTKSEIIHFLQKEFPQSLEKCEIEEVTEKGATVLYHVGASDLRPGGTISGPTMMTLADYALYIAILGEIGIVGLTVTTNLSINFLQKPVANQDIRGVCHLMKVGKVLIVGDVWLYSVGMEQPIAHVVGTYSIPPKR
ncbi:PaaI family thioesterase [Acinetobacter gerneri]|uniref:PaaI family thioesterase n=1 Tax=Acinetobacter gerneri TaxID=202952 RepID=A0AAW8JGW1_9GAMM|nr:PaaI family thioesterase [Acinetobacter gerneri]MDQ9009232.1 PaaI family thioesterase [Acinetobacter gerneri]MDQ9013336.1 PaaI family thioesterase [Acinetobacter gerneri]MDQ9023447.1 PaaI family thioesterase [Acinetobacter gerneri]MDQ9052008.1 PaaI family thioesterase [Acinetobacter gerneri]MDQ9059339.1 PaaI family thioesterase [Acinetobacter gerneri]